jgi:hypothetical protein
MRGTPKTTEGIAMPGYVTYLDTVTRHGAPLTVRSYENGRGAQVFVRGECIGSIDNPAVVGGRGFMRRCFGRTANLALAHDRLYRSRASEAYARRLAALEPHRFGGAPSTDDMPF